MSLAKFCTASETALKVDSHRWAKSPLRPTGSHDLMFGANYYSNSKNDANQHFYELMTEK